ncbi:MAG: hypothetical protein R2807_08135 [Chitinophagales bacterium]
MKNISGYSKLSKQQKIDWLVENYLNKDEAAKEELISYWHQNAATQKTLDEFSENTITNYFFPFSVAPNFLINGEWYCLPMAIEESSVVAAMSIRKILGEQREWIPCRSNKYDKVESKFTF